MEEACTNRRESRRQEEGRRGEREGRQGGERESRRRKGPGEIKLGAKIIKGRGGRKGGRGRERERETRDREEGEIKKRRKGSEFVRASECACEWCAGANAGGRGRAGAGSGLPSSPARSSLLGTPEPQPRAGARRKDSMLSLLVWILTLSDTFSQVNSPTPLLRPLTCPCSPSRFPRGSRCAPRPGERRGARPPAARSRSPGRHEVGAGSPRGVTGGWRGGVSVDFAQVVSSVRGRTEIRASRAGVGVKKGSDRSKSLPEPLAALLTSTLRGPESGRLGPGGGRLGKRVGSQIRGAEVRGKRGTQAPEDVAEESRPSFSPAPGVAESEPRLQTAWGCPLQRKGGVPRGLWWGFEPLPASSQSGVEFKGGFGPAGYGSGHSRGRRDWGRLTPLGQKSMSSRGLLGLAGKSLGDGGRG